MRFLIVFLACQQAAVARQQLLLAFGFLTLRGLSVIGTGAIKLSATRPAGCAYVAPQTRSLVFVRFQVQSENK